MNKTVAFEIGTEEMPAIELRNVTKQLKKICQDNIGNSFEYESIEIHTTPRRLIVLIKSVPEVIESKLIEKKGPKVSICYDGENNPTKAAIGFARGAGIDVDELKIKEFKGEDYVFAIKKYEEKKIIDILPSLVLNIADSIVWRRTMRWGSTSYEFARPVRWVFAMFGSEIINLEYCGLKSSNYTYGHRFLSSGKIKVDSADSLVKKLNDSFVSTTENSREQSILKQVKDIENRYNLTAKIPPTVMAEVVNLCEWPTCMVGSFDELFLSVPKEIIVDAMLVHQRYFPLFSGDKLSNKFIVISNGDEKYSDNIVYGNECVVNARLYDAKFFYDEDKKQPLESYVDKLDQLIFQDDLGTMKDKALRLKKLSSHISDDKNAQRAAYLAKADLVTSAVFEFSSVQGIMGGYYAESSGEDPQVCIAIKEHYMPRFANDDIPSNHAGQIVALCDKIDNICGMFAINKLPSGSSDPFALRRASIGIISILLSGLDVSLLDLIDYSLDLYLGQGINFDKEAVTKNILDFFVTRAKVILKERKIAHDAIEAVFASNVAKIELIELYNRAVILDSIRKEMPDVFDDLATAFSRANNLRDVSLGTDFDASQMNDYELNLLNSINACNIDDSYKDAINNLSELRAPVDDFFENVMIMDKDEKIKNNRIKLLNAFCNKFAKLADFSKMAKK